ncbi:MAG: sugar ABC transporter substrate-binding protein [Chloroflexi bacterium]|nr:sugar ABC transporter substrate-binding protein [Chloroflexota bacterium]
MKLKILVIILCLVLVTGVGAQEGDRPYEGTTLNLFYFPITYIVGLEELLPEFEEATGMTVEFELLEEQASVQKAQLELASGAGNFDVVGIQSGNMPLYAQGGWVTPIEDFYDGEYVDAAMLNVDDFVGSTMDALAFGGTQYCLPMFAATTILYYQIDKFEAAGIEGPPATYDELLAIAPSLHSDEVPMIALRGNPPAAAGNIWIFNSFFHGEGASYFADFPDDLTPTVNSPEAIRALTNFVAVKNNYGPEGVAAYVYDDVVTSMQQGTVVMVIDGAPLAGRILHPDQSKVAGNLGFAVMPGGAAGPKPGFAAHGLCVVANSDKQEAAYKFVEWALSFDTMKKISLSSPHVAVSRNSLWEDADFIAKYDYNYGAGSFIKAYQDSLNAAPADHFPPFAAWPILSEIMGQAVQEAEIGVKTPEQALNDANDLMTQFLEDEGYLP